MVMLLNHSLYYNVRIILPKVDELRANVFSQKLALWKHGSLKISQTMHA